MANVGQLYRVFPLLLFFFLFSFPIKAGANYKIYTDNGNMPRCLVDPKNSQDGLLFLWKEHKQYQRTIFVTRVSSVRNYYDIDHWSRNCSNWQKFNMKAKEDIFWERSFPALDLENTVYEGISLPEQVLRALAQVARGASIYMEEKSAKEFLEKHPIAHFTKELNQELSAKYGNGFIAELYAAWIEKQRGNEEFRKKILAAIDIAKRGKLPNLSQVYKNKKFMFAKGYMQSPKNDRIKSFVDELHFHGILADVLQVDPVGTIEKNARAIRAQIEDNLSVGHELILVGASKGMPEVLLALSELKDASKIVAVINMSGMIAGSFLIDWMSQFPINFLAERILEQAARDMMDLRVESFEGLYDMSSARLEELQEKYRSRLPQHPRYYNFVGVLGGSGIAKDPSILALQKDVTTTRVGNHGANDGYVEYPGTSISPAWVMHLDELVFHASHIILDGSFAEYNMENIEERRLVLSALFYTISQQMITE